MGICMTDSTDPRRVLGICTTEPAEDFNWTIISRQKKWKERKGLKSNLINRSTNQIETNGGRSWWKVKNSTFWVKSSTSQVTSNKGELEEVLKLKWVQKFIRCTALIKLIKSQLQCIHQRRKVIKCCNLCFLMWALHSGHLLISKKINICHCGVNLW